MTKGDIALDLDKFVVRSEEFIYGNVYNSKHIAFTVTENYVCYAGIVLTSILENSLGEYSFHIFSTNYYKNDMEKMRKTAIKYKCNIYAHIVDDNVIKVYNDPREFSYVSYYRLIIPEFMEKYTEKFFYTDVDVCFLKDIKELWNFEMDDKCALVVEIQGIAHRDENLRIGVEKYFVSGGMLINTKNWKKNNISSEVFRLLNSKKHFVYPDMDILNIALENKVIFINYNYQYQYSISYSIDAENRPSMITIPSNVKILHYTGAVKPWNKIVYSFLSVKPFIDIMHLSEWNDIKLYEPNHYKQIHKAARLAKKEGNIKEMLYWYAKYSMAKIKYLLRRKNDERYVDKVINLKQKNIRNANVKHILLCGDTHYIKYIGVTMTSILLTNKGEEFEFHIFVDSVSEEDLSRLEQTSEKFSVSINIYFINVDVIKKFSEDMHGNDHISVAAYFRFIAFGALYKIVDKVLYLDSDICVLDDKINIFWKVDLLNKIAIVIGKQAGDSSEIRLNVEKAFNSGVIFVDINNWNESDLTSKCIEKACEKVWPFLDQDVLNMILDKKFISVKQRYNYEFSLSKMIDDVDKPSKVVIDENEITILHYIGASKPWHTWVQCCPVAQLWVNVKKESCWEDSSLASPSSIKKQTYKYFHKAARVSLKEHVYMDVIKNYVLYVYWKARYFLNLGIS